MYGGFGKHIIRNPTQKTPARLVRFAFSRLNALKYSPDKEAGVVHVKWFFGREGHVRISGGWTRVLEVAADNR
jgi:hypothetical protein